MYENEFDVSLISSTLELIHPQFDTDYTLCFRDSELCL